MVLIQQLKFDNKYRNVRKKSDMIKMQKQKCKRIPLKANDDNQITEILWRASLIVRDM